ncbi:Cytochrome p450 [Mycena venus]|uniref:Cytochrome p450 n=1 Tax=Mycena venus TaxID=2733690 RepID=A0A8H6XRU4_9AGAR|nr:Cytochrome p450 [Mycena venus]
MAHDSVWFNVVSILTTFNIGKTIGDDGQIIEPTYEYSPALVFMPLPFKRSVKPRSALIRGTVNEEKHL